MVSQNKYRKINIFYADDLAENVRNLLDGIQRMGLVSMTHGKNNKLILNLPDNKEHYEHNRNILQGDDCLINLDYSTKIDDAIKKIRKSESDYDLVVCDLYFGDNDEDYVKSKVGGIWLIYWAMHLSKERKLVCKLYSGQLSTVVNHIDYKKAYEFVKEAYNISLEEIEKSHDAGSWREHLEKYLWEVQLNIIPLIDLNERVDLINYIAANLRREYFTNKKEDGRVDLFQKDLLTFQDMEFNMNDGRKIKLIHLFPILIGSHFTTNDKQNFSNMDTDLLERTLYKNRLIYKSREERNNELLRLQKEEIQCKEFRDQDETGRPIYGIEFTSYDIGIISQIENSLIQSLNWTYQLYRFYKKPQGFCYWSGSSSYSPFGLDQFDRVRKDIILPSFQKIRECFEMAEPEFIGGQPSLANQIDSVLANIDESYFWTNNDNNEQQIEHGFQKLKNQPLFDDKTKDTLLPLKSLFRIKVADFFKIVLHIKEGDDYTKYENTEFQRIKEPKFYWYCNAFLIREGLKDLKSNIQGDKFVFYLLESREKNKELIKYKIILRDFGRGVPSIIRKFNHQDKPHKFISHLNGFCQLIIRSKMNEFEGISFNVFTGKDETPCPQITETGTEFEIMFTQGRER